MGWRAVRWLTPAWCTVSTLSMTALTARLRKCPSRSNNYRRSGFDDVTLTPYS